MALGNPSAYRRLATLAAGELGTAHPAIIAAILAQWTCEQPRNTWPPVHNNPGFVTVGALKSNGIAAAYATTRPGIHFLAQFPTPDAGATAYGRYVHVSPRYAKARAAIKAGDGAEYLRAITRAGYGTGTNCSLSAYKALGGSVAPSSGGGGTGASAEGTATGGGAGAKPAPVLGLVVSVSTGRPASATPCPEGRTQTTLAPGPVGDNATVIPIPVDLIGEAGRCTQCPPGWSFAVADPGPLRSLFPALAGAWVDPKALPPGTPNACAAPGVKAGDSFDAQAGLNYYGDAAAGLVGALGAVLGPALITAAELGGIIGLGLIGVYFLFRQGGERGG